LERWQPIEISTSYYVTDTLLTLEQLVPGSPVYSNAVGGATAQIPPDSGVQTRIPLEANSHWAVLISEWRHVVDGVTEPEPYMVAFNGRPVTEAEVSPTSVRPGPSVEPLTGTPVDK
jgi:hypothetical protein